MEQVRYGIIGTGNQGSTYAKYFEKGETTDAVLGAVCDINEKKLDAVKGSLPTQKPAVFTDYREMLSSGKVDAVIVAVPHYDHPKICIDALSAGIHTICEKPAGVYTRHVNEMNAAASGTAAKFGMMFNQRTNCIYRKMREIIAGGGIGELQRVTWIITDWYRNEFYYNSSSWRATWIGEGGGVLINQCPHQLDLVQWVVGKRPVSVRGFCGYGAWHDIEVEDEVTAYFKYDNGATGMFITTTGESPGTNRFEVSGTLGKLICENDRLTYHKNEVDSAEFCKTSTAVFGRPNATVTEVETDGKNPQHLGIINNFTAAILGKEPLFVDGKEGIYGVELMNAIELSGWQNGREVTLPVDGAIYEAELNARRQNSKLRVLAEEVVADTAGTYGSTKK